MNLHKNIEAFRDAIRTTSDHLGIRDVFIEKDYWVTFILKRLSQSSFKEKVVFKGGTSLSKVHNLINRFSEDVDLAILKSKGQSETQERIMIRKVEKELTTGLKGIDIPGLTSKQKHFRKTAYNFDKITENDSSVIQDKLIIEINSFANPVPFSKHFVNSMIAQYLVDTGNEELIIKYQLEPFELFVLDPMVTLIEKILALVRLSFFENGVDRIRGKVRHFYDIYFLTSVPSFYEPENVSKFKTDLSMMFEAEKKRFHDPDNWLKAHYSASPLFKKFDDIWRQVKGTYENDFRLLVHGEFPDSNKVLKQMIFILELLS